VGERESVLFLIPSAGVVSSGTRDFSRFFYWESAPIRSISVEAIGSRLLRDLRSDFSYNEGTVVSGFRFPELTVASGRRF